MSVYESRVWLLGSIPSTEAKLPKREWFSKAAVFNTFVPLGVEAVWISVYSWIAAHGPYIGVNDGPSPC